MLVKLSSKGQLVIPKSVRKALHLQQGDQFRIQIADMDRIVLERVSATDPIDALYGKYADADFLSALEREHREEIASDG